MKIEETAGELMTKEVISLEEFDNLNVVAGNMEKYALRHLPVVDGGRLVGIVSHRDLLKYTTSQLKAGAAADAQEAATKENTFVSAIMTRDVKTVRPETSVMQALGVMLAAPFGCLPVVDGEGMLVGVLSERDFLALCAELLQEHNAAAS